MNESLRIELEQMREADQDVRKDAMQIAQDHGLSSPQYQKLRTKGLALQEKHTARLVEILEEHGWPGVSLVGELACSGAFLVLQHAALETQKKYLPLLREATAAGDVQSTLLPLLEDRVRMADGEKQLYGSQITRGEHGEPTLWPIEDEAHVDERRASAGLEPLVDYLKRFGLEDLRKGGTPDEDSADG